MRTILCTALLLIACAAGQVSAGELTAAQAQQILAAAQQAKAGGEPTEVKLTIDGQEVVFKVSRDAVGNIIARPVPSAESGKAGIAQASIGSTVGDNGALVPNSLVQVNTDQTVVTYNLTLNQDGTIASLYRPGQALANGLPPASPTPDKKGADVSFGGGGGAGFTLTIILPAGTSAGQSVPPSQAGL